MVSEENLAAAAQASGLETKEAVIAQAEEGALTLKDISEVDDALSRDPAPCGGMPRYLAAIAASSSDSGSQGGVDYSANSTAVPALGAAPGGETDGGSSLIRPFSGPEPGALDLEVLVDVSESASGLVSLAARHTTIVNVPIGVDSASSLCDSSLRSLRSAFVRVPPCNSTSAQAAFASALPSVEASAAARGFRLAAGWGFGTGCGVDYWITLVEPGVAGATGSFQWTVLGSGGAAWAPAPDGSPPTSA
jgi:hypothetical protein